MTEVGSGPSSQSYSVGFDVERQLSGRNRVTTGFRIFLGLPHLVLVGAISIGLSWDWSTGVLGAAAAVMAVIAWFAIVFAFTHPRGLWDFCAFYLRWRARALPYLMLLRDDYPPFEDAPYPTTLEISWPTGDRNRLSVGLRLIYAIPHVFVLVFLNVALLLTSIVAWFAILFTGKYPPRLYEFAVGVLRWDIRVEAFLLLMRDEYPPFQLGP